MPKPKATRITIRQQLAIAAMLTGATDLEAAKKAGINKGTLYRWKVSCRPFQEELLRARAELWPRFLDGYNALLPRALKTLKRGLNSKDEHSRLYAAGLLLRGVGSILLKAREIEVGMGNGAAGTDGETVVTVQFTRPALQAAAEKKPDGPGTGKVLELVASSPEKAEPDGDGPEGAGT